MTEPDWNWGDISTPNTHQTTTAKSRSAAAQNDYYNQNQQPEYAFRILAFFGFLTVQDVKLIKLLGAVRITLYRHHRINSNKHYRLLSGSSGIVLPRRECHHRAICSFQAMFRKILDLVMTVLRHQITVEPAHSYQDIAFSHSS